jgi:Holliday junction resolvase RusA-like endonuclease
MSNPTPIAFTVPGPPHGKGRAKIVKIGGFSRMATPKATVAYEGLIALAAQEAMAGRPMLDGPVSAAIAIDCAVPASWSAKKQRAALAGNLMPTTKPDADNVVKAIFDGLNGVAFKDDVQVVDLRVRKRYSATPAVRVQLVPVAWVMP